MRKRVCFVLVLALAVSCLGITALSVSAEGETGKFDVVYSNTLEIKNDWWDGNLISASQFDGVAEGEKYIISADYTYLAFDLNAPSALLLQVNIKTGNNWINCDTAADKTFYVKAAADTTFTALKTNADKQLPIEAGFTGTVAIPLDTLAVSEGGYTVYSLEVHHITFHNNNDNWDASVSNVMFADQDHMFPPVEGELNLVKLDLAIEKAEAAVKDVAVSADGADVDMGKFWVTADAMASFNAALTAAKGAPEAADATQESVDAAEAALTAATQTLEAAKAEGTRRGANYGLLRAVYELKNEKTEWIEAPDGGALTDISRFDKVAFTIDNSANTKAVDISIFMSLNLGWVQEFTLAYSAVLDIEGVNEDAPAADVKRYDRFVWLQARGEEKAVRAPIEVCTDMGYTNEVGYLTVPAGFQGTVYAQYRAFKALYTDYQVLPGGKLNGISLTAKEAVENVAVSDFRFTDQAVSEALNLNDINGAIADAEAVLLATLVDTDGSATSTTELWTTQQQADALRAAVAAAREIAANASEGEQATVDAGLGELETAIAAFREARTAGTKDFFAIVSGLISEAEGLIADTVISTTASEVDPDKKWVTADLAGALLGAVEEAKALGQAPTQKEFEDAIAELTAKMDAFRSGSKDGTKGVAPKKSGCGCGGSANAASAAAGGLALALGVFWIKRKLV